MLNQCRDLTLNGFFQKLFLFQKQKKNTGVKLCIKEVGEMLKHKVFVYSKEKDVNSDVANHRSALYNVQKL